MGTIYESIENVNKKNQKALSIFVTSGYPNPADFVDIVKRVIDSGADLIEIGIPFGDSLADGPVIQKSFVDSLRQKINIKETLNFVEELRTNFDTPIILMSSSNPVFKYGVENFIKDSCSCGVNGLIVPDVPLEEYYDFYNSSPSDLDVILLTTPTSSKKRIKEIDNLSRGFLYCVSVAGTTGIREKFNSEVFSNLARTYKIVEKNKMLVGFGISSPSDIDKFSPYCDGVIVGSALVKILIEPDFKIETEKFIKRLSAACKRN